MSGGWIACADEMPDDCNSVMAFSPLSCEPVWPSYCDEDGWYDLDGVDFEFPVTHWQNFPAPPY